MIDSGIRLPWNRRLKLLIAYDGSSFSGWQRQKHDRTIQGEIEKCLSIMTNEDIFLHGAGRTDGGVHAEGMVAHFDCSSRIPDQNFMRGLNSMLPGAIRILDTNTCDPSFHARFSAIGKKYHYTVFTGKVHPPRIRLYSHHVTAPLNLATINSCLQAVVGTHDFSSFENSGSRDKSLTGGRGAVRTIYSARLLQQDKDCLVFEFIGDGFLKNMVRNLVGTILEAGRGKFDAEQFAAILAAKDRSSGGPTAPPQGLFLKQVFYQDRTLDHCISGKD
ncbi:tRNA pseudouridine(38-40) synthase TruA [Desulforhopalus singaporensis]|uniref:tRNA pseudouridine synthase A n=1 Tax=Desulforhopalus singaporensis TaxID=91360 RepID=A0A1H0V5B6_9BACT|nr:tRNA pseudouridine(38-40) synthase TruA [Desulforhopalus singaporensis]SDP73627.1 tRNA pseudouridine38-40 synthase [Desulforhopalus singaporensis]